MANELFDAFNTTFLNEPDYFAVDSSGNTPFASASSFDFGPLAKGLKFGGSAFGAFGNILQGKEIAGADQYNAQLALQQGEISEEELATYGEELASTQRALYSKAGVELSGSPLDVMLKSATNVELDKQITAYNAKSKADMLNYEAEVAKAQGQMKAGQSLITGGLSLLGLGL